MENNLEDLVQEICSDDFEYVIKKRGEDYYDCKKVQSCLKSNNKYYAKVLGSNSTNYNVEIELDEIEPKYSCTCPCDFNCKHEYAVLLAIKNKHYCEVKLKGNVKKKTTTLESIIKTIPAEELKQLLINETKLGNVEITAKTIENKFYKYFPKQNYSYYYNNLYNELLINSLEDIELIKDYINTIYRYIKCDEFDEVFKIIRAIVEAIGDTDSYDYDFEIDYVLKRIELPLHTAYNKGNKKLKESITNWINKMKKNKFYRNYFLEDILSRVL